MKHNKILKIIMNLQLDRIGNVLIHNFSNNKKQEMNKQSVYTNFLSKTRIFLVKRIF